jgi:hypothetical protein
VVTAPAQARGAIQEERATKLGPFTGGLHNASGSGEFIQNEELYELVNMEVDTDGSLVNRPQINVFTIAGVVTTGASLLGVYLPNDGRKFLVLYSEANQSVHLVNAQTGVSAVNTGAGTTAVCCIQYSNRLWVIAKTGSTNNGGYFDAPTPSSLTWTVVPTMPKGEAVAQYRERIWIASGMSATSNTSRFYFSAVADPSVAWNVNDYIDCAPGNGQKLVDLQRLGQDLVLFKEHSTYKFTYTTDPRKAELNPVDDTIGVPAINCTVVYKNNTVYVLHDNSIYELFQYTYTRISDLIYMDQVTDLDLFAKDQYGLTLHRDRLFVRYFKYLYVYNLDVNRWSSWESVRKFSKVVVIPSASVGLDTAYAMSASQAKPGECYQFQDIRATTSTGVVSALGVENFQARITTKTYDFDLPQTFKVIFWWGIAVATSGNFTATLNIPNATANMTWGQARAQFGTYAVAINARRQWANNTPIVVSDTIQPTLGRYARKFIKLLKKVRFRQVYFTIIFDVITNGGIADASLRVYDLTIFIKKKQGVVKETS